MRIKRKAAKVDDDRSTCELLHLLSPEPLSTPGHRASIASWGAEGGGGITGGAQVSFPTLTVVGSELKVVSVTQAYLPTCDGQGLLIWPSECAYHSSADVDEVDTLMIPVLHPIPPFSVRMYSLVCFAY